MNTATADQVWGAAVAAQRINGAYLKEDQWDYDKTPAVVRQQSNKGMVRQAVKTNNFNFVTEADIEKGRECRNHFRGYLLLQIAGKLNDFQQTALKIAQYDEFNERQYLELAICASLPSVAYRDMVRKDFESQLRDSVQLTGDVGAKVQGTITVQSARWSHNVGKYMIQARMGDSFVDFWYGQQLTVGDVKQLKGKIKQLRDNNATQLNYVKLS